MKSFVKRQKFNTPASVEVSGTVDETGPDVTTIKKGDRVAGKWEMFYNSIYNLTRQ